MTEKEAIEIIERIRDEDSLTLKASEACTMAINALSKQIPKKPKYSPLKDGIVTTFFECPKCGCRRLGHGFDLDKCFCPECGQKLNWEISGND